MAAQPRTSPRREGSGLVEAWWPYIAAGVATFGYSYFAKATFPTPAENLLSASGGAAAVLVGFLATAKAIILSITGSRVYKALKSANYTEVLLRFIFEAIVIAMGFLVVAILGFFVGDEVIGMPFWYPPTWFFAASLSLFLFWRFADILFKMLRWV